MKSAEIIFLAHATHASWRIFSLKCRDGIQTHTEAVKKKNATFDRTYVYVFRYYFKMIAVVLVSDLFVVVVVV